jgi:hypothetical protein
MAAIPNCFYCNKSKNEILLTTHFRYGEPSPDMSKYHGKVIDFIPCDTCQGYMKQGVILVSVQDGQQGNENPYRTGGWWVITLKAAQRMFPSKAEQWNDWHKRFAFIEDEVAKAVGLTTDEPAYYTDGIHLIGTGSVKELHAFAAKCGIKRCWFHNPRGKNKPHYDIVRKRETVKKKLYDAVIEAGARPTTSQDIVEHLNSNNKSNTSKK